MAARKKGSKTSGSKTSGTKPSKASGSKASGRRASNGRSTASRARASGKDGAAERAVGRTMTQAQRRTLLAAPERYDELTADLLDAWATEPALRVPSLTLARLRSLSAAARRARAREAAFRAEMERRLGRLFDARLQAENDLWRAVLEVNAAVKSHARSDAAILDRFAFLSDAVVLAPTMVPDAAALPARPLVD